MRARTLREGGREVAPADLARFGRARAQAGAQHGARGLFEVAQRQRTDRVLAMDDLALLGHAQHAVDGAARRGDDRALGLAAAAADRAAATMEEHDAHAGLLRQFQQLDVMRAEMDASRQQAGQVIATLGRGLHFRRKPIVEAALKQWTAPAIRRELNRLQTTIFQSRSRASLEESLVLQNLMAIAVQSARR